MNDDNKLFLQRQELNAAFARVQVLLEKLSPSFAESQAKTYVKLAQQQAERAIK